MSARQPLTSVFERDLDACIRAKTMPQFGNYDVDAFDVTEKVARLQPLTRKPIWKPIKEAFFSFAIKHDTWEVRLGLAVFIVFVIASAAYPQPWGITLGRLIVASLGG